VEASSSLCALSYAATILPQKKACETGKLHFLGALSGTEPGIQELSA
jgi:hypothetical protein